MSKLSQAERNELGVLRQLEAKLREAIDATQQREEKFPDYLKTKSVRYWAPILGRLDEFRANGFKAEEGKRVVATAGGTGSAGTSQADQRHPRSASAGNKEPGTELQRNPNNKPFIESTRRSSMAKLQITPEIEAHTAKAVAAAVKAEQKRVAEALKSVELPEGTTARAGAAIMKAVKAAVAPAK